MFRFVIEKAQKSLGVSQKEIAKMTGTSTGFVSKAKNGPSKSMLASLKLLNGTGWLRTPDEYDEHIKAQNKKED